MTYLHASVAIACGAVASLAVRARSRLSKSSRAIILVDNGSIRSNATLVLRKLAQSLENRLKCCVVPASARWSSRVPAEELGGVPAELFEPALRRLLRGTMREGALCDAEVTVLPLFIGPSRTVTSFIPEIAHRVMAEMGGRVRMAPVLSDTEKSCDRDCAGADTLARVLLSQVGRVQRRLDASSVQGKGRESTPGAGGRTTLIIVLDHGSPSRIVTSVRDAVAARLGELVRDGANRAVASGTGPTAGQGIDDVGASTRPAIHVQAASMERREGSAYDYCEPLLERALAAAAVNQPLDADIIIAMLFALPGKHAGAGGDVAEIIEHACAAHPTLLGRVHVSPLLSDEPAIVDVLAQRAAQARLLSS